MIRVGDLLVCCDNLCIDDMVKIVGKNDKVIIETLRECLDTPEIKKMTVECFYIAYNISDHIANNIVENIASVISVNEDL